jgi:hypothetical protein
VALTLGWQNLMNAKLNDARAVVTIQRVGGTDFRTARAIRTRTTIFWDDLNRTRNVTLETVRF